jgi:uncharacterized protein (DUF1501 family)
MVSRRSFLKQCSLFALAPTVQGFLAHTARALLPERDKAILVVIQLDGGNDGINTVVPFADEGYAKYRKVLRLTTDQLLKVNNRVGLHPSMEDAAKLLESGRLAIVQGVGYPNPNRSHFQSMAIWHAARLDAEEQLGLGWLGRGLDTAPAAGAGAPSALFIGAGSPPVAVRGRRSVTSALERLDDFLLPPGGDPRAALGASREGDDLASFVQRSMLDAYAASDRLSQMVRTSAGDSRYPTTRLGQRLQVVSQLLKSGLGTRVFYTIQSGYDTHARQLPTHAELLGEFSSAVRAFLDDLNAAKLADRVLVLAFSEFGRRVEENGSGTDHGTAGPVFLFGSGVRPGLVGKTPRLMDLEDGDLKMGIDFRRVYASVLRHWLGVDPRLALEADFEPLPLFRG